MQTFNIKNAAGKTKMTVLADGNGSAAYFLSKSEAKAKAEKVGGTVSRDNFGEGYFVRIRKSDAA